MNKSRAQWRGIVTKIPLQINDDLDKVPQISDDIKCMLRSHPKVFLGKEVPYCFLSRLESSFGELTLGCNLKHMVIPEYFQCSCYSYDFSICFNDNFMITEQGWVILYRRRYSSAVGQDNQRAWCQVGQHLRWYDDSIVPQVKCWNWSAIWYLFEDTFWRYIFLTTNPTKKSVWWMWVAAYMLYFHGFVCLRK